MDRIIDGIIARRKAVVAAFLTVAVVCAAMIPFVGVNYDMVDYLPDEPVAIVDGSETNLKITTPSDMPIAEGIARSLDPEHAKEEAKARMHAVFAEAFSQMHSR